jgi:hypothetical protein
MTNLISPCTNDSDTKTVIEQVNCTYSDDFLGAGLGGEHGQDTRTGADVEYNLALEQVLVVVDGVAVRQRPHLIL